MPFLLFSRYDNHREQILRGSQTDYEDKSLDVFQYFTASCYRGFEDTATGFYAVYGKIFEKIAAEDIEFMECDTEFKSIPLFGKSTSEFETVVGPFYAYWQSYCTKKSYSWLCPHNVTEIRDRRLLREIEKETKKIAQKARRERNEEIRALVAFVRKRDKRVVEHKKMLEERAEQNRIKQQEKRLEQLRKNRKDVADMQKLQSKTFCTDGHEEKLRQMEEIYASTDDEYSDDYSNYNGSDIGDMSHGAEQIIDIDAAADTSTAAPPIGVDPLSDLGYCIACDKSFKNKKSFRNHLSSKRHIENQKIHETLMNPKVNGDDSSKSEGHSDANESHDEIKPPTEEAKPKLTKTKSKKKAKTITVQHLDSDSEKEEELTDLLQTNADDEQNGWSDGGKKSKKSAKGKKSTKSEKPKSSKKADKQYSEEETAAEIHLSAAKSNGQVSVEKSVDVNLTCVTCKSTFGSKNKLFNHLKSTGHGVYIDKSNPDGASVSNGQPPKRIKKKQFYSKVTL